MNSKVLFIVPHDSDHREFLDEHPEIEDLFASDPELFERYLNLERDNGAAAIALAVKDKLAARVDAQLVIVQNCPRGIIDANRIPAHAVRNIFDFETHQDLHQSLLEIYWQAIGEIEAAFNALSPDGLFIDLHTMNDFDLFEPAELSPGLAAMQGYVDAHVHPEKRSKKRALNLICSRQDGPSIAHPLLHTRLANAFRNAGISTSDDLPYCLHEYTMLDRYMHRFPKRGIGIDLPICELSKDDASCNINPVLDSLKIDERAEIIASSISDSL